MQLTLLRDLFVHYLCIIFTIIINVTGERVLQPRMHHTLKYKILIPTALLLL